MQYLCAMMDLLHNLSGLCYVKLNIIRIVLTSLCENARARARFRARACANLALVHRASVDCDALERDALERRKQVRERAQATCLKSVYMPYGFLVYLK